ncbi:GFA family protein [Altererythrobacter salegens]|uniref:GFA family protein n=1 Tax=Croceibacterium salegens TaxID=1737568 RepID=A0A6I4SRA4_9SPHN|nr:GFA family protein [Croceibacterium salegens]
MPTGRCHCGAIRYSINGERKHSAICHCETCRRTTGGLTTAWLGYASEGLRVEGEPRSYSSSEGVERQFCGTCGTSLFYFNEAMMPGVVDILTVTLDDPAPHAPQLHVNMADTLPWEAGLDELPKFDRFPG